MENDVNFAGNRVPPINIFVNILCKFDMLFYRFSIVGKKKVKIRMETNFMLISVDYPINYLKHKFYQPNVLQIPN